MAVKVALIGARLNANLGGPSLLLSSIKAIRNYDENAVIKYLTPAGEIERDNKLADLYGVEVLPMEENFLTLGGLIYRLFHWFPFHGHRKSHYALKDADVIIDVWGIMFTDFLGKNTLINRVREGLRLALGRIYKTPMVKATSAMGPFELKWNKRLASFYLKYCVDAVITRDEKSFTEVQNIGINSNLYIAPDTAFLLPAEQMPPVFDDQTYDNVLISVSHQARSRANDNEFYVNTFSTFIKNIITRYNANVTLLPNAVVAEDDDLKIAQAIGKLVDSEQCQVFNPIALSAMQIKGLISQATVVVASRYHTVIAALSLGKPTITVGWHHKYKGVLGLFGLGEWDIPVNTLELDLLQTKFDKLWDERVELSAIIEKKLPAIKAEINSTFALVLSSILEE